MDKAVLVTGCSSGFGRLIARKFQRCGWNVVATMRSPERETELGQLENVLVTKLDVTDRQSVQEGVDAGLSKFGRIDALVNNAGLGTGGFLEEASEEDVRVPVNTNLLGVIFTTQAVLPIMRRQGGGAIVNITSLSGTVGIPMLSLYNATKFAVEGLSESLRFELERFGISVKTIAPGHHDTNFMGGTRFVDGNKKPELDELREKFKVNYAAMHENPPRAFQSGDPEEVANLAYRCVTEKTPNKIMVGRDARTFALLRRILPHRTFASLIRKALEPLLPD